MCRVCFHTTRRRRRLDACLYRLLSRCTELDRETELFLKMFFVFKIMLYFIFLFSFSCGCVLTGGTTATAVHIYRSIPMPIAHIGIAVFHIYIYLYSLSLSHIETRSKASDVYELQTFLCPSPRTSNRQTPNEHSTRRDLNYLLFLHQMRFK